MKKNEIVYLTVDELKKGGVEIPIDDQAKILISESLEKLGFMVPVIINSRKEVIDGNNRLGIAREKGYSLIPCIVCDCESEDEKIMSLYLNLARRQLTPEQRIDFIRLLAEAERERAQKRMLSGQKTDEDEKGRTRERIARITGESPWLVRKVLEIEKKKPELLESIKKQEITLADAHRILKQEKEEEKKKEAPPVIVPEEEEKGREAVREIYRIMREYFLSPQKGVITERKVTEVVVRILNALTEIVPYIMALSDFDVDKFEKAVLDFIKAVGDYKKNRQEEKVAG